MFFKKLLNKIRKEVKIVTSGVYKRKPKRKPYPEEAKKKMSEIFLGRKIVNGHWTEKEENKMDECNGGEITSNKTSKYLEKWENDNNINDVELMDKLGILADENDKKYLLRYKKYMEDTKDENDKFLRKFQLILKEEDERKHKPIRKVSYFAIKDKEEDVKEIEESHNKWIEQERTNHPEAKITLSLCKDVMIRNERGQFEVVNDK